MDEMASQTLFEDECVRISFVATPSSKKAQHYLDIRFWTENVSESKVLKSVKLTLSKSSWLRPREKEKSSFVLAKKVQSGSGHAATVKMKCSRYSGDSDCIKCKVSYHDVKSGSLSLQFATHSFVIGDGGDGDGVPSEEEVLELMENEDKCGCSATERLKVPKERTCGDALDTLVRVWRLSNVTMTDKKAMYYGKLMLDKELVVYVRTNTKKNAVEITAKGQDQGFVDSMLQQFKAMVMQ